jgi:hypothetical protein
MNTSWSRSTCPLPATRCDKRRSRRNEKESRCTYQAAAASWLSIEINRLAVP